MYILACNCDPVGSEDSACDRFTGQCSCKPNVSFRTCNACIKDFYGIESKLGCRDCLCNKNGSLSSQCRQDGQCLCHNSTVGFKCDRCRENYFNFTKNGCRYYCYECNIYNLEFEIPCKFLNYVELHEFPCFYLVETNLWPVQKSTASPVLFIPHCVHLATCGTILRVRQTYIYN